MLIMEQMLNKSVEDFMILGTFTGSTYSAQNHILSMKRNRRHSLYSKELHFPTISPGGEGQNTFTWRHIISDIYVVSKIYHLFASNPLRNKALYNQINNK